MTNNYPKISVIMSAYNSEKLLSRAIESILNQTFEDLEILIADDGSSDKTYEICNFYSSKFSKVKIIQNEKNIGLTKTLNKLIKESTGDFIARHDSDDVSHKFRLEKQYSYLMSKELDACTTRAKIIGSKSVVPGLSYYFPKKIILKFKNPFIHGSLLIKKSVIEKIGLYNEKFYFAQDYKLMNDIINRGYKVSIYKEVLYELNMEDNISMSFKEEQKYFADCVKRNIIPDKL